MTAKSEAKKSKKQVQIVETAEFLFAMHGVKRISVEEICSTAGVSKMTFYKYFANKIALVRHIWDNWVKGGFKKLDEISAMNIPFPEKIELMFDWKKEFGEKMGTGFIEEILSIDFDLEKIKQRFLQFISDAQQRGDIRPEILPEFFMAVLEKLYELALDEDLIKKYPNYMDFRREMKDFFWYGILTRSDPEEG